MNSIPSIRRLDQSVQISEATILISNLRLRTFIGFNPDEKTKQQDIIVNTEIRYRADAASRSDDADDALNYKNITKEIIRHVEEGRFQLLEKLVADLLGIASKSERVSYARVSVDKPHALRFADSVSVTLTATRNPAAA